MANPLEAFPIWARELSEKYYSRTISMFVLHGNVRDLVAWKRPASTEFPPLQRFLKEALFGQRDLVISYDRGGGLSFATPEMKADFDRALTGYDSFHGTTLARGLARPNRTASSHSPPTTCARPRRSKPRSNARSRPATTHQADPRRPRSRARWIDRLFAVAVFQRWRT